MKKIENGSLTRGERAKTLGIGKTTLRHWEASGKAKPVNTNGQMIYPPSEVMRLTEGKPIQRLAKAHQGAPSAADADGETAAQIFERLDNGMHPVDIVKELRLHPDVVNALVERWHVMRKSIVMTEFDLGHLSEFDAHLGRIKNGPELAERIAELIRTAICRGCYVERATHCEACARDYLRLQQQRQLAEVFRKAEEQRAARSDADGTPITPRKGAPRV